MRIQLTKNIYLDEMVDPFTYFNEVDNGKSKVDMNLVNCIQFMRDKLSHALSINNWWGYYISNKDQKGIEQIISEIESSAMSKWSGYRSPRCTIGAKGSSHKLGKGGDPKGDEIAMYNIVIEFAKEFYDLGLRRIEDTTITNGWLHMDTYEKNCLPNQINVVGLKTIVRRVKI